MHRFFGKKKEEPPARSLDDVSSSMGKNMSTTESKIAALDQEIISLKQQMNRSRNPAQKEQLKRRALMLLKQKKQYERQRDSLFSQQMNIDNTKFMQQSMKDTADQVKAMKAANKELKATFETMDIDEIEDMHYDMQDMMVEYEEIQEVMSRQLGVPDYLDEDELLGELDDLYDDDIEELDEVPGYIVNANTAHKDSQRETVDPQQYANPQQTRNIQL